MRANVSGGNYLGGVAGLGHDVRDCLVMPWLEKKADSKYRYLGDYMNQYSWAETLHAELDELNWAMEDDDF